MSKKAWTPLPDEFWARPAVAEAVEGGDLGAMISQIITERGTTETALGQLIGCCQTQVSQWVTGKRRSSLESLFKFAAAVEMPASVRERLPVSTSGSIAVNSLPTARLHKLLRLAEQIGRTGDTAMLGVWRELTSPTSPTGGWEQQLARVLGEHRPPSTPVIERMSDRIRGLYFVAAKLPARLVIRALTGHVRDLLLLLDAMEQQEQRRQPMIIGGESSYLAACCDVDLGRIPGALELLDTVALAAERAGDNALAAMGLDGQSHFAAFQGRRRRALELVEEARGLCTPELSAGTDAYLWLRTAEAHADLGHVAKTAEAWEWAEAGYAKTDLTDDRNWVRMWLGRDCWESVRAVIYASTRRPKEAVECAARVAARLTGQEGKTDAIALVNAALAQARSGMHKPAAITGAQALRAVRAAEASTCLPRAQGIADIISPSVGKVLEVSAYLRDLEHTEKWLNGPRTSAA
jgi:transcriptional regulator with XRE-family HTH domain